MNSPASGLRFLTGSALGLALLWGCATSPSPPSDAPVSASYLLEYSTRIQEDLNTLNRLVERSAPSLGLAEETLESSRTAVRDFLASLADYRGLLEEVASDPTGTEANDVRDALLRCRKIHGQLQEQALQLNLIGKVVAGTSSLDVEQSDPTKPPGTPHPSVEYRRTFKTITVLATSIDDYLNKLHQKSLVPYAKVRHPAEGVFHFLRLQALQDPELEKHVRYFHKAWRAWMLEKRHQGDLDQAIDVFQLVLDVAGDFRPDSLQPLGETILAGLEKPPELARIAAMEESLAAVRKSLPALPGSHSSWDRELEKLWATLKLVRAHATEAPGARLALALEARKLNPQLTDKVNAFTLKTASEIGDLYLKSQQYEGAIVAFRRTLDVGALPDLERRSEEYRARTFERGLEDARKAARQGRFGPARMILEQLGRLATDQSERTVTKSALHSVYLMQVSHSLERDLDEALELAREMVRIFPDDTTAKKKMDEVLVGMLRKQIGDLPTCRQRLGTDRILDLLRGTVSKMSTGTGTEACRHLLGEIEDVWTRDLRRVDSAEQVYSIAFDIARLKGEPPQGAKHSAARALARHFEQVRARGDWSQLEACINQHLTLCPSEELPAGYRDGYLELLAHLEQSGSTASLGRHLAIFATTFPDEIDAVRKLIVERMDPAVPEHGSFYALLKTVAPQSEEVGTFEQEGRARDVDVASALARLIGTRELEAARLQYNRRRIMAPPTVPSPSPAAVTTRRIEPRPRPVESTADTESEEPTSETFVVVNAVGCSVLIALLAVLTQIRGFLAFRWYALAALWLGAIFGLVLGSPSGATDVSTRIDLRPAVGGFVARSADLPRSPRLPS